MVTAEDFSRLVEGIYTAATVPQQWEQSLDDLRRALGGAVGALCVPNGPKWSIACSNLSADAVSAYAEHYSRLDHVLDSVQAGVVGVPRTGRELINRRTEFYADWMRPNRLEDALLVRLTADSQPTCLVISSARRNELFATPERTALFQALVPHLRQAVLIQDKLTALGNTSTELAAALDQVRHGIMVLASNHVVLNVNSAAQRILQGRDGLSLRGGRLQVYNARSATEFASALAATVSGGSSGVRGGWSTLWSRPSGRRPYIVHVVPYHRWEPDGPPHRATTLLLIIDPDTQPDPPAAILRRLYGLTHAEADVALHVMHGEGLKEISALLSVSLTTVRTHLQHVFDKTGTHRQAELVHLLHVVEP
jgi:DNA-binding CsgD family transcriptional regulator/PAS domain-containing protein